MGSSKGVLLSGVALIIGFYTVGIKRAQTTTAELSATHASTAVAENLARTGMRFALNQLSKDWYAPNLASKTYHGVFSSKDTVKYTIDGTSPWTTGTVTSTGYYNGIKVRLTASISQTGSYQLSKKGKKRGFTWEIADVYVKTL